MSQLFIGFLLSGYCRWWVRVEENGGGRWHNAVWRDWRVGGVGGRKRGIYRKRMKKKVNASMPCGCYIFFNHCLSDVSFGIS